MSTCPTLVGVYPTARQPVQPAQPGASALCDEEDHKERHLLSGLRLAGHVASTCPGLAKSPRMCCPRAKLLAGLSQAERSEARRAKRGTVRRAKRAPPPPKAAAPAAEGGRRRKAPGAVRRPRASRGPPRKARGDTTRSDSAAATKRGFMLFRVRRHRPPSFSRGLLWVPGLAGNH